jgi:ankyrin repeat protein
LPQIEIHMLIFIGYRREDSAGHAGRLFDRLVAQFGAAQVFRDVDTVDAGADYVEAVRQKVEACDVLLALIGPRWLSATDADGRWRLADEQDLVRVEITTALARNARVIPVLLQGATMPRASDLPGALTALARRNAVQIRDTHFDHDADELLRTLAPGGRHGWARRLLRWPAYATVALVAATVLAIWLVPRLLQTPERARAQLAQLNLAFDRDTFIDRVRRNDEVAVALFLKAGMSPDTRGGLDHALATEYAVVDGNGRLLSLLANGGADTTIALRAAARQGRTDMVADMLARELAPGALDQALVAAAAGEQDGVVRTLLGKGARGDARWNDGRTALTMAAGNASVATVQLLLEHGADIAATFDDSKTALHEALDRWGDDDDQAVTDTVRLLLDKGASLEARATYGKAEQPTPLLHALQRRHPQAAVLLLERGADAKAQMTLDDSAVPVSALMLAAEPGYVSVIPLLLAKGLDVNAHDAKHQSVLMRALWTSRDPVDTVRVLLAAGATQEATPEGVTPLMRASAIPEGLASVRLLLAADAASINATDSLGMTALMYAADSGRADVVPLLLAAGADRHLRNREGSAALMLARKHGHERTTKALMP